MLRLRAILLTSTLFAVGMLSACGGESTNPPDKPSDNPSGSISVSISPATTSVDQGATIQFAAFANGSNPAVTWSIQEGSTGGSISQAGLFTAPATAMNVHVVATSVADPGKSASALVTVNVVRIAMPSTAAVQRGRQRQFTAEVTGTVVEDLTWTVVEGAGGAITTDGLYTAPMSGGPFHVTARSVADPSKAATATVVLTDHGFRMLSTSTLVPRNFHTATLLPNGKVLIVGGFECDSSGYPDYLSSGGFGCSGECSFKRLSGAELFDPATETFSATGSMSFARAGHTATLLNDGTVLVTGDDSSGGGSDATTEIYDPATGSFARVGDMTQGRAWHTASLLGDGRVLIAGGSVDLNDFGLYPSNTAEVYDPATQTFSAAGDMPEAASSHTASVLLDGTVLVVGGYGVCDTQTAVANFDPAGNSFSPGVNLAEPRAEHTGTTLNDGRVLITGGWFVAGCFDSAIYDTAVIFNPATSSYSSKIAMREPRAGHSATLLADGKVLVVGSLAEVFDPATSTFSITGDPVYPRATGARLAYRTGGCCLPVPTPLRRFMNNVQVGALGSGIRCHDCLS